MRYRNKFDYNSTNPNFWKEVLINRTITNVVFNPFGLDHFVLNNGEKVFIRGNSLMVEDDPYPNDNLIIGIFGDDQIGYDKLPNPLYNNICNQIQSIFLDKNPDKILTTLNVGFDMFAANIASKLNIPFIAISNNNIPDAFIKKYNVLLSKASSTLNIENAYDWIIDNCDFVVCYPNNKFNNLLNKVKLQDKDLIIID